jgi:hypothetical protein
VNTFRGDLQLATLDDLDRLDRFVARLRRHVLNLLHDVVALEDLPENNVTAIKPAIAAPVSARSIPQASSLTIADDLRGDDGGNEELGAIGVLPGVGHGQNARLGVLELEVLVGELLTIDWNQ